jgi:hypothetical protein
MTTCTTIAARLEEFAGGTLPAEKRREVEAHLSRCPRCADGARALVALSRLERIAPDVPEGYWEGVLPRVRRRLDAAPAPLRLPAFAFRIVPPAAGALFALVVALQLIPLGGGGAAGDAGAILGALPESDLAQVADHHDSEALITLPAEAPEAAAPDLDDSAVLQDIVETEAGPALYAYLDTDTALGALADDEQSELISLLEKPEGTSQQKESP